MEIKFKICDLSLKKDIIKQLVEEYKTNYFMILVQKEETINNWFKKEKKISKYISILNFSPNIIIFKNDVFYEKNHKNEKIIGYCPLIFEKRYKEFIKI